MPAMTDFRTMPLFHLAGIDRSGKDIGKKVYWQLYTIENIVRVVIHSVLSGQITPGPWWNTAVSPPLQKKAMNFHNRYLKKPWHSSPGNHGIYYLDLLDLNEIIRPNSHLFLPIIPDIDQWMAKIEQIQLPRNVVAHMNWPNPTDRMRIEVLYQDIQHLAASLDKSGLLSVP